MIPSELERLINKSIADGEQPLMVSLTGGTTVLGAFDPIEPCVDICKKHDIWVHVDAAWGGGALVSKKYRHLFKGVELADSVTWNPHKLMGVMAQCSTFLTRHEDLMPEVFGSKAAYLFQPDKAYDSSYDVGDKSALCGRLNDVLKLWLSWKAKGDSGFEKQINHLFEMAELLRDELAARDDFELVIPNPQMVNVCFWFIPKSIRHLDRKSQEYYDKMHTLTPIIKKRMLAAGSMMIGFQPYEDKPNFWRLVMSNAGSKAQDMRFIVNEIARLGDDL